MGGRKYRKTVYAIAAALLMSTCSMPVMAAPYSSNDKTLTAVSSDQTYAQGLDTEARIIKSVEQDQRSPYVNTGIAVTDTYLEIHKKASNKSDVVGKLYGGSGCEVLESTKKWTHIKSGTCEGYVAKKNLVTGYAAQQYAMAHGLTDLIATSLDENSTDYLYKEPSEDSDIVSTVMWDQEVEITGETDDHSWVSVKIGDKSGYLKASSIILDVKYEEAVAETEAPEPVVETQAVQVVAETQPQTETSAETETEAPETEAPAETEAQPETEAETEAPAETEAETEAQPETEAQAEVSISDTDETVYATYSVSIRDSYSTDANIIGALAGDDSIVRTGVCDNGWSRVNYNGTQAYIKSDYLTTEKPAEPETEAETEAQTQAQTEAPASDANGGETVYAAEDVNIRESASTDADVIGGLSKGESVTRVSSGDGWSCILINGITGYINSDYLTTEQPEGSAQAETPAETQAETQPETAAETQAPETQAPETQAETQAETEPAVTDVNETVYVSSGVNVRASADKSSKKLGTLYAGQSVTRTGTVDNGWSRIDYNGSAAYVKSDYLTTEKPAQTQTSTSSSETSSSSSTSSGSGSDVANFALQYVGYPYVYGGNSLTNGVDCSGFTQQVYLHFGYSLPRTAAAQSGSGKAVTVSASTLQPGDLLFYGSSSGIGHVAIYIGNGQIVHASTPSTGIKVSNYNYRTPVCARRIL